jgi:hypothetical protein
MLFFMNFSFFDPCDLRLGKIIFYFGQKIG